jgi:hypothetical protein
MALTTNREEFEQMIARLEHDARPEGLEELSRRLDAVVEAMEIFARNQYDFPGMPESRLRSALARARRM